MHPICLHREGPYSLKALDHPQVLWMILDWGGVDCPILLNVSAQNRAPYLILTLTLEFWIFRFNLFLIVVCYGIQRPLWTAEVHVKKFELSLIWGKCAYLLDNGFKNYVGNLDKILKIVLNNWYLCITFASCVNFIFIWYLCEIFYKM